MAHLSTERFSDRVADYIRYRPDYPQAVMECLRQDAGLSPASVVGDIGSGTGIFTRHLLEAGSKVYAIEPNGPMRQAAEALLRVFDGFVSVDAAAEDTGLPAQSLDLIVCAQAFHWFNNAATKAEFQRILKPDGFAALIWNNRLADTDAFSRAYEALLREKGTDYKEVNHQNLNEADFQAFYKEGQYTRRCFPNNQIFDEAGLIGRAFSASYIPPAHTIAGQELREELKALFRQYSVDGTVCIKYMTEVYLGCL
jgi:SAM-dependent methyltransferase